MIEGAYSLKREMVAVSPQELARILMELPPLLPPAPIDEEILKNMCAPWEIVAKDKMLKEDFKQLLIDSEFAFMESHKDEPKLERLDPRSNEEMSYIKMLEQLPPSKGVYIRSPWPTEEELDKARQENPDCAVWGGYGCINVYSNID